MRKPIPEWNCYYKYSKYYVFQIRKRTCDAALFQLRCWNLVEKLLNKAKRTEPPANCTPQYQPEEKNDAKYIPSCTMPGRSERILYRPQRAGSHGSGA